MYNRSYLKRFARPRVQTSSVLRYYSQTLIVMIGCKISQANETSCLSNATNRTKSWCISIITIYLRWIIVLRLSLILLRLRSTFNLLPTSGSFISFERTNRVNLISQQNNTSSGFGVSGHLSPVLVNLMESLSTGIIPFSLEFRAATLLFIR